MNKQKLTHGLRELADILLPFAEQVGPSASVWNGSEYVKALPKSADPYALMWYATLTTVADMLDAQDSDLSTRQIDYIRKSIFGTAGSLTDFFIDTNKYGQEGESANKKLDEQTTKLFSLFKSFDT